MMNAPYPDLPEPTLAAWSRTARPVRLPRWLDIDALTSDRDTEQVDDLMFGCSTAVLMAMPLVLGVSALIG